MTGAAPDAGHDRLRTALRQLAEHAPPPRGAGTAARAAARHRARRRRGAGAAAAVLAIAAVLVAIPATVSGLNPAPVVRAEQDSGTQGEPALYDLPVRGSLAGDTEFLAGVQALDWGGPAGPPGGGLRPAGDTRRVVYAADVPNGSRWVLVLGRVNRQQVHAWFTGPAGAAPGELLLTGQPARTGTEPAITLLDGAAPTGLLVVVGRPGDDAEYSPSLDRDAGGRLSRTYTPLPVVDGVPLGEVSTPVAHGAGQVRVLRARGDRVAQDILVPTAVNTPPSPAFGIDVDVADPQYWQRLRDCLVPLGFEVVFDLSGPGVSWSGGPAPAPDVGPLSSAEQAQNNAAFDRCVVQAAAG